MWVLVVNTYEGNEQTPVLTHEFYGDTQAEAQGIFKAHIKYDEFLRASVTTQRFKNFAVHSTFGWRQRAK